MKNGTPKNKFVHLPLEKYRISNIRALKLLLYIFQSQTDKIGVISLCLFNWVAATGSYEIVENYLAGQVR